MELLGAIILVAISIPTLIYAYFKYSFEYWRSRGVPTEPPFIPYGNAKGFGKTIHTSQYMKKLYDKYKPTGAKLCGAYIFARPVAVLLDLEVVKSVLVKDFAYFNGRGLYYNEADDPLSAHLFSLDGEPWKKLRAKLTPTFTSGRMKFMFPTFVEVGARFRDCLLEVVQQHDELEMKDLCARFSTDIIGTCAFGIECNSLKDPNAEFRHYGRKIFGAPRHSILLVLLKNGFKTLARRFHVKHVRDDVSEFFLKVVRDTVDYREKNNISRNDFMDILIKLKNQETTDKDKLLTFNEIAAQAYIFFLAGFETSSTTLTFCLYELAINPEIQSKARQVIRDALEKHNGQFTYEMMLDMPYIDQVLQETLRKYPSLGNLIRMTKKNYQVPGTNINIEKGTTVFIPALAIQNDPEYFQNPEKFDPVRFSSEEKQKRDAMTWLAFGDGPRNCIGLRFGMMQSRIGLVTLLNNFEFSLGSKTKVPPNIEPKSSVTQPQGGIYLRLKTIKQKPEVKLPIDFNKNSG